MRLSSFPFLFVSTLWLGACSQGQPVASDDAEAVLCSLAANSEWTSDCRLETARVAGATVLVIRHPDGSFRRLIERSDGFAAADGFQTARTEFRNGRAFVTIDDATYSLPDNRQP